MYPSKFPLLLYQATQMARSITPMTSLRAWTADAAGHLGPGRSSTYPSGKHLVVSPDINDFHVSSSLFTDKIPSTRKLLKGSRCGFIFIVYKIYLLTLRLQTASEAKCLLPNGFCFLT